MCEKILPELIQEGMKNYVSRYIDSLLLFSIREICLSSGRIII
jgi:hypothetical protein